MGKRTRGPLDPDDVLRGRVRPDAAALCALIRSVNPSGTDAPAAERARRYAWKSKLQSLLVARFQDEIDVAADPAEGEGVVLLRHRPSGQTAAHAVIAELDDDARSWVQRQIDLRQTGPASAAIPAPRESRPRHKHPAHPAAASDPAAALLAAARRALDEYDYDAARSLLEQALHTSGAPSAAEALLDLLVDTLGADADALALAAALSPAALAAPPVRRHLALAAARTGDRRAAHTFARDLSDTAAAAVLAALARHALHAGDTAAAARDLAAARAHDPAHPDLRAVQDDLDRALAAARKPLEDRILALVAEGRLDEAAATLDDLPPDAGKSPALRAALRTLHDHRRRTRAADLVARAEHARAAADLQTAIGLLRQALLEWPDDEDGRAARLLAASESEERALREAAEADHVLALLTSPSASASASASASPSADPVDGLVAYLDLPAPIRARVRADPAARPHLPHLAHLDETGVTGGGARARAAVAAVLALARAEHLAETDAEAALDLLHPHDKLLDGVRAARRLHERGAAARHARLRAEARQKLADASALLTPYGFGPENAAAPIVADLADRDDVLDRSHALLSEIALQYLDDAERERAVVLRDQIQETFEHRRFSDQLARLVARGDIALARENVERHTAQPTADTFDRGPVFASLREALDHLIQSRMAVRAAGEDARDLEARGLARAVITDAAVPMPTAWGMSLVRVGGVSRTTGDGRWLIHTQSRRELVLVRLIDVAASPPLLRTCVLLRTPQPLRLCFNDASSDRLVCAGSAGAALSLSLPDFRVLAWKRPTELSVRLTHITPPWTVDELCATDGVRRLWMHEADLETPGAAIRVLDSETARVVHEEHPATQIWLDPLPGAGDAAVAVTAEPAGTFELRRADGPLVEGGRFTVAPERFSVAPHPRGGAFALVKDPTTGALAPARFVPGAAPALSAPLPELRDAALVATAADLAAGRVFVLHEDPDDRRHLLALAAGDGPITPLYRVPVPSRSQLAADVATHRVSLIVFGRDLFRRVPLDAAPPDLPHEPDPLPFLHLPAIRMLGLECHRPPERLPSGAPRGPLEPARAHANIGAWQKVRNQLRGIDESYLDDARGRHFAHLLGLALLDAGEHEAAHRVLLRGLERPGPCDLHPLVALAAPRDPALDAAAPPAQRPMRDLLRRIDAADAHLKAGDAEAAIALLDDVLVWEARELQSMCRLAFAMLRVDRPDPDFRLRKLFALATLCELEAEWSTERRELFLRDRWDPEVLAMTKDASEIWLRTLGEGEPPPLFDPWDRGSPADDETS